MKVRKAVLPVAGLGTRFLPATKVMPKEMLTVVDKPLIQYAIEEAWGAGIEQIILVTSRGKEILGDHFDLMPELERSLKKKGKELHLKEIQSLNLADGRLVQTRQSRPLGLGHAVWCARDLVGDEPFAVLLPDDIMVSNTQDQVFLGEMVRHYETHNASMIAVMEVDPDQTNKYGILDPGPQKGALMQCHGLVEKPDPSEAPSNMAIIGRYVLSPEIFRLLGEGKRGAGGEIQLTDAMEALRAEQPIYGVPFNGIRYDCGDKVGFQMANLALSLERKDMRDRLAPFIKAQAASL
ncbi:MAG: UTP--glucose-1-phosphate uridylyltransferase GalU [Magnetococcales bacterium]|nr:UTP--glucose-1-phosphate uridylyltransferase GalU [Magnetococcales bacterium]